MTEKTDTNDPAGSMMEPFFWHGPRSFCSDSIIVLLTVISPLMDPEGQLPCTLSPPSGPYLQSDESSPHPHTYAPKIKF